ITSRSTSPSLVARKASRARSTAFSLSMDISLLACCLSPRPFLKFLDIESKCAPKAVDSRSILRQVVEEFLRDAECVCGNFDRGKLAILAHCMPSTIRWTSHELL